jgi:nucleoside-diphosphate-sugar epimerase
VRILVTGAAGFVGGRLVRHLADRHELYAVTRRPPPAALADCARWIEQDLRGLDPDALPDPVDAVVHLAQSTQYRDFPDGAADVFAVNVGSTFGVLDYARRAGARAFVLASTGGVYGYRNHPISEAGDEPRPSTFYFRSKRSAELLAEAYSEQFAVVVLRPFFVYGAGQTRMLIPTLIAKVTGGKQIVVDGNPGLAVNPIHVDDAVRAFAPALELGRSVTLNVAGAERVTITELVRLIGDITGRPPAIRHTDAQPEGDLVADIGRLRELLGVVPEISLADGLREAIGVAAPSGR